MSDPPGMHGAVVLAAGSSTRLGQPKQLLTRDGETLLHRAVRLAAATSPVRCVVVLPERHPEWALPLHDLNPTFVFNGQPARGLRSSLYIARDAVRECPHVLVLTCDQPALDPDHLQALLKAAVDAPSGCAVSGLGDTPGVPAVVPGGWFADLRDDQGERGFGARLRALPAGSLAVLPAFSLVLDIDTPEDLRTARAQGLIDP